MLPTWNAASALDRVFDDVMRSAYGAATNPRTYEPDVDVHATADRFVLRFDVPGVKRENLDITIEKNVLTVTGNRTYEQSEGSQERVMLGRAYGSFRRSFALPEGIDDAHLSAHLQDGVLTVEVPRQPRAKPRKVEIGTAPSPQRIGPAPEERTGKE